MKRILVSLFVVLFGCSSSASTSDNGDAGDAASSIAQACTDAAQTLCQRIQDCAPFFLQAGYGDLATCESRALIGCTSFPTAPGATVTPDQLEACVKAVQKLSCDQLLNQSVSSAPECDVRGTLDNGKPCAQGLQCSSGFCPIGDSGCGTCAPRTKAGDPCVSKSCSDGLSCVVAGTGAGTCEPPPGAGADCSGSCAYGYGCVSGKCTAVLSAGAACDPATGPECNIWQGLTCQSNVCTAVTLPKAGEACGAGTKTGPFCAGSAVCSASSPTAGGVCIAPAEDGAACDAVKGPGCKPNAKCVGGVCKVPDVTTCK